MAQNCGGISGGLQMFLLVQLGVLCRTFCRSLYSEGDCPQPRICSSIARSLNQDDLSRKKMPDGKLIWLTANLAAAHVQGRGGSSGLMQQISPVQAPFIIQCLGLPVMSGLLLRPRNLPGAVGEGLGRQHVCQLLFREKVLAA